MYVSTAKGHKVDHFAAFLAPVNYFAYVSWNKQDRL